MTTKTPKKTNLQPIDRLSLFLMVVLSLVAGVLVWGNNACTDGCSWGAGPRVLNFSWQDKRVGAEDSAFILTFDRPVDRASVENNLVIEPPLPGKISWAGRRIAYTLAAPAPYGNKYRVELAGARVRFPGQTRPGEELEPFAARFATRDRAFAYIGTRKEERGRLILYNWTEGEKFTLTPPDLSVTDYKPFPKGDRIVFSATKSGSDSEGLQALQLYTVRTGANSNNSENSLELILDNLDYQNNNFDISADGETIVVQRVNRKNPDDFGLWAIDPRTKKARPLSIQGGEFLIAPDSQNIAVAQGEGIAILPLKAANPKPLDFLPKFGRVLSFTRDGSGAAMVNFNADNPNLLYTRSLFYVNNLGIQKELLNVKGSIIDCEFNPTATHLYCLLTQLVSAKEYREQPYFVEIDLKTSKVVPLIALDEYQDIQISMAPDGLGILFSDSSSSASLVTNSDEATANSSLWLLLTSPLKSSEAPTPKPEQLPFSGIRPQWLP